MSMSPWHHRTRDTRWLAKVGLGIVLASAALALLTDMLRDKSRPLGPSLPETLVGEPDPDAAPDGLSLPIDLDGVDPEMAAEMLIRSARRLRDRLDPAAIEGLQEAMMAIFSRADANARQQQHLALYLDGLGLPSYAVIDSEPLAALKQRAAVDVVAALFAIDLAQEAHPTTALSWAGDWAGIHDSDAVRRQAVLLAIRLNDHATLRSFLDDPSYQSALTPSLEHRAVLASGDFRRITALLWQSWGTYAATTSLVMALFAGVIWFILTLNLEQVTRRELPLYLVAVLLGALSTFVVLVVGYWQDSRIGWGASMELVDNLVYYTAGVALREELAKLLAAAPLLLWLALRGGRESTALVAAGCVGLGFAIEENLGYFGGIPDGTVVSRFLTANFLHIATTGLSGLALFRMFRHGWRLWDECLAALLLVIGIHGGYNTALSSTDFLDGPLDIFAIILLGILSWRFYGTAVELAPPLRRSISPLAVFIVGLALLLGVTFNVFLWHLPFWQFTPIYGLAAVGVAPIAFLFINHYRDA